MIATKKIILIHLFVIGVMLPLQSQTRIDSLKFELTSLPNDTSSISTIVNTAKTFIDFDNAAFLDLLNIAEQKAMIVRDPALLGRIFYLKGVAYIQLSNFPEASKYLTMAKIIAEKMKNDHLYIVCLGEIGSLYEMNTNLNKALEFYELGLQVANKQKDPRFRAMLVSKKGGIYYRKHEFEKSIQLSRESYWLFMSSGDTNNVISSLNNLSLLFSSLGEIDSAEYYLNESKKLISISPYDSPGRLVSYYSIKGKLDLAKNKYSDALATYQLCIHYANLLSFPGVVYDSYLNMSYSYEKLGDYQQALKYHKLYVQLLDSVVAHENFVKAMEIEDQLETQIKENELLRINADNKIKQTQLLRIKEKQNDLVNYIILLVSILILFIFLLVALISYVRSRKKAYALLQQQNKKIESQSKELSKSAKLIAKFQFQMNPHFVFNALHNIQGLIIGQENAKATEQIQRLADLMRKTYNNAEKDFIPIEEEVIYLKTYFRFEANTIYKNTQFDVIVTKGLEEAVIPPMIIQPFIENSIKHGELNKVKNPYIKISITREDELLCVSIEDNGKGIKNSIVNMETSTHSMAVIKSRIELIFQGIPFPPDKNVFTVGTIQGANTGTRVKFFLPLQFLY